MKRTIVLGGLVAALWSCGGSQEPTTKFTPTATGTATGTATPTVAWTATPTPTPTCVPTPVCEPRLHPDCFPFDCPRFCSCEGPTPVPTDTPIATQTPVAVAYVLQNSTILGPGMTTPEALTGTFDVTDHNPHCCNAVLALAYSNIHWQSASVTIAGGDGSTNADTFTLIATTFLTLNGPVGGSTGRRRWRGILWGR